MLPGSWPRGRGARWRRRTCRCSRRPGRSRSATHTSPLLPPHLSSPLLTPPLSSSILLTPPPSLLLTPPHSSSLLLPSSIFLLTSLHFFSLLLTPLHPYPPSSLLISLHSFTSITSLTYVKLHCITMHFR